MLHLQNSLTNFSHGLNFRTNFFQFLNQNSASKKLLSLTAVFFFSFSVLAQDVGVSKINSPQSGCNLGSETVSIDVTNFGPMLLLTTIPLSYQLDGNAPVTQNTLFTTFGANSTQTVIFSVDLDMTGIYGTHILKAYSSYSFDTQRANDTITIVLINYEPSDGGLLLADDTVCASNNADTLILTKKTGDVIQWESNSSTGWNTIGNIDTFYSYSNLSQTTNYRVLVKNGLCASDYSDTATIMVESQAKAGVLGKDRSLCIGGPGDTLRLTGYEGKIKKWQSDNGSGWTNINNTDDTLIYSAPTVTKKYRVIVEKNVCRPDTSNIATITIISGSKGGNIIPLNSNACAGNNHDTLVLTNSKGDRKWEFSDDNGFTWQSIVNSDTSQIYNNLNSTRKYRVFVQASGCSSVYSDIATVNVLPQPEGGIVERDKSICGGTNKDTLILKNYTGSIIKWQSDNGSGWVDIANTTNTLYVSNILKTTRYRAIVGNTVCANDTSSIATLTVIATTYGGKIVKSDSVCMGINSNTLVLKGHIGDIRWWERSTDNGASWTPIANFDTTQKYVNLTQTTWYRVLVEGTNCPRDYSDTATITVYNPMVKITPAGNTSFCKGGSVVLSATAGYPNYSWSSGQSTQSINATNDGLYKVTVTDKRGCKNSDSIRVTVYNLPLADAGPDITISLGASTKLMGKGGVKYLWKPGQSLNDSNIAEPLASPWFTTTYRLTVTDNNGCMDTDTVKVTVVRDYNIHAKNVITPNGDGINDSWKIDNILPYEQSTVTIINRYGYKVYEKSGYDNSWDGTDGKETVSDGTYYYIITFDDSDRILKGHITVLSK